MKNTVLILGHSFIVRLRRFVHSAEHAKVHLLNQSERVISGAQEKPYGFIVKEVLT